MLLPNQVAHKPTVYMCCWLDKLC